MPSSTLISNMYQYDKPLVWLNLEPKSKSPACKLVYRWRISSSLVSQLLVHQYPITSLLQCYQTNHQHTTDESLVYYWLSTDPLDQLWFITDQALSHNWPISPSMRANHPALTDPSLLSHPFSLRSRLRGSGPIAQSVEFWPRMRKLEISIPSRVKWIIYDMDTFR